MDLGFISVHLC